VFMGYTFTLALSWNLIYFILKYIDINKKINDEKVQIEVVNKHLEIDSIKSKLQPHFIFNALNSIKALVQENPDKARESILQLSNILRNSIVGESVQLVTLENEMKIVNDYLGLECIRFEERLRVQTNILPQTLQTQLPPLILQSVVENAVKHGIALEEYGGFINISSAMNDANETIIRIENSGTFIPIKNESTTNFGLSSSAKRLQYMLGDAASLNIQNTTANTVLTTITIPQQ
jgi:two-component system, LytTR family, sensor kinase